ncbi:MAG: hypothetical protein ACI9TV_001479 [Sulfurimonas sp.]|jgi:hypothetical protein|uniref:pentapeptide repeat-containing protein n=1 Tax=Sulfurimonas sp. TaxID=2022749 RepID=UPI0039E44620
MAKCSVCNEIDVYEQDKCILHCKKTEENGWYKFKDDGSKDWKKSEYKIKEFWEKIQDEIDNVTSQKNDLKKSGKEMKDEFNYEMFTYEYKRVIFPVSIINDLNHKSFYNLDKDININFDSCRFLGKTDFSLIQKAKNISFQKCLFCDYFELKGSQFNNLFLFENCKLYKKATFQNIIFNGTTSFIKTTFYDNINFIHTKFESLALFNNVKGNKLNFDNTFFKDEANFLNIKNKDGKKLESKNIENRETARIIKHSFEKLDNIIEANKFYALEMEKREEELDVKNFAEWLVFKFHKISSNHSQDWLLPILWMFSISFFYIALFQINDMSHSLGDFLSYHIINVMLLLFLLHDFKLFYKYLYLIIPLWFVNLVSFCNFGEIFNTLADKINPFSIMTSKDPMTFHLLLYKIIIAYLIYQFIISIRQNTRRK